MITAEALPYFETFCTSVVLGSDVVPRLNRNTVENLKHNVARAVRTCNRHKLEVIGGFLVAECCGGGVKEAALEDTELEIEGSRSHVSVLLDEEGEGDENERFLGGAGGNGASGMRMEGKHPDTYLPGRVLYFRKEKAWDGDGGAGGGRSSFDDPSGAAEMRGRHPGDGRARTTLSTLACAPIRWWKRRRERRLTGRTDIYRPVWAHPSEFQEIMISLTMGQDHMPNNLMKVLDRTERIGVTLERNAFLPGVTY